MSNSGGNLGDFRPHNGSAASAPAARRPLPPQPPRPALPPNPYPSYQSPAVPYTAPLADIITPNSGSLGRRALPTPPVSSNDHSPSRSRALPTPPGRLPSGSYPDGPPPPPPPRPSDYFTYASREKTPLPLQPAAPRTESSLSPSPSSSRLDHSYEFTSSSRSSSQPKSAVDAIYTSNTSQSDHTNKSPNMTHSNLDNEWLPILERFGDLSTNLNDSLKAPSSLHDGHGRDTPIQKSWPGPGDMDSGGHDRLAAETFMTTTAYHPSPQYNDSLESPGALKVNGALGVPSNGWPAYLQPEARTGRDRSASAVTMKAGDVHGGAITPRGDEKYDKDTLFGSAAKDEKPGEPQRQYSDTSYATGNSVPLSTPDSLSSGGPGSPDPPHRQNSSTSSLYPRSITHNTGRASFDLSPSWAHQAQTPSHWVERKLQIHQSHRHPSLADSFEHEQGPSEWEEDEWEEEEDEEIDVDEGQFFQPAFLSEMALQLRDKVERRRHIKAGIAWVGSFTGKDIVTTIHNLLPPHTREKLNDRRFALLLAQSLQNQLWFVEVDWDIKPLRDSSDDVFRFMGEMEGMASGADTLTTELPKGLMTMATRCYSPSCTGDKRCYSPRCPYKTSPDTFLPTKESITPLPTPVSIRHDDWKENIDPLMLRDLSPRAITRQDVIRQALSSELAYEADLSIMEDLFITHLRLADPPIIPDPIHREEFIHEVFHNALELREASKRLIEEFTIRQREQPIIQFVGDLFLQAATEFRNIYPEYTGSLPQAEVALSKELEENTEFRLYTERVIRENDRRRDIRHLITRPSAQLQRYPALLEGILNVTDSDDPDREFLSQALQSIQFISSLSQLKLFHASKGRGPASKLEWFDLVTEEDRKTIPKKEQKRQMLIWELIQGEIQYVADLEVLGTVFAEGLRMAEPAVIDRNRLDVFLDEAFHNWRSLYEIHSRFLQNLQIRQLEQHPHIGMISDLVFDAALNWQEAYMEYVPHYPIAKVKVQEEEASNSKFASFLKACLRDPMTNKQDIDHFMSRPIFRLLRYPLLLDPIRNCLKETAGPDDPDYEQIPQVMEVIASLGKAIQKGVISNESKVELWAMQRTLDGSKISPRTVADLDLANPMRELIHRGTVYRQSEGSIGSGWTELNALLFDNFLVLTKLERPTKPSKSSRKKHSKERYAINRPPIPLELLSLGSFSEAPRVRNTGRLFGVGGASHYDIPSDKSMNAPKTPGSSKSADTSKLYPFSISFIGGQGQLGGSYTLWADSYKARQDWKEKFEHAKVLRAEINDAGKVFEMSPLSVDTFYMPPSYAMQKDKDSQYTGRVTCSCPFITQDQRRLVAVGCQDGVWIGIRGDSRSLRKVLHVKSVTSIAVLEEFSIFLVLSDKSLVAYQLEALVPSAGQKPVKATTERISMPKEEISSFTVGRLDGRTLLVIMRAETTQTVFKILEPVLNKNTEDTTRQRRPFGFLGKTSEWFRPYKMFYLPAEVYGVHFLKHKMAIVCSKGFEIMDLTDLKGGSIPIFDPAKIKEKPFLSDLERKCTQGRALGMFRSTETEFLLCYETFGLYIHRYGEPNRDCRPIEWQGRHDSVAFHPPYLLLISAPFIEIRHIDTGKLLQIYTGSDLRLTWEQVVATDFGEYKLMSLDSGSGGQKNPPVLNPGKHGYGDETKIQEPQIHICQRTTDHKQGRGQLAIGQVVYELSPTLLLNNPLLNPPNTLDPNYLPPVPLTSHANPAIRQARPPSVRTTNSSDQFPHSNLYQTSNPSQGYIPFPNAQGYAAQPPMLQRDSYGTQYSRDSSSYHDSNSVYNMTPIDPSPQSSAGAFPIQPQTQPAGYPSQGTNGGLGYAQYPAPQPPIVRGQSQGQDQGYGSYNDHVIRAWAQNGGYGRNDAYGGYE
ncbi:hypothetical protein C359_04993 [Cryptococcus neoformans Bt120]|nr:hypothetical protein C360_06655 [Cryptococcus neoformans var. grubii Bt15]OXG37616.1 hypothetical protein C359_04993 [Cryptococcus neoformans var. grubii Bt120]